MGLDFLRQADWLNRGRIRGYLIALALLNGIALLLLLATSHHGVDRNGFLIGTDFLSFWSEGQVLRHGGAPYDAAAYIAVQRAYFPHPNGYVAYFYPPNFIPFCFPLGFLPYFPALAIWLGCSLAAFGIAVWGWFRRVGIEGSRLSSLVAFPPVLIAITHGQTSFIAAALLGGGTLVMQSSPWLAGGLIGLAAFKPQLGLLLAPMLLASREWRVVGGAAASCLAVAALVSLGFGFDVWTHWRETLASASAAMENGSIGFAKMQSVFAAARLLGLSATLAYALQGLLIVAVVAIGVRLAWRRRFDLELASLALAGGLLVTPYVFDYDLVLMAFPLIYLASGPCRPWEKATVAATFIAPAFARPLAVLTGVPIMPVLLVALFALLVRRALAALAAREFNPRTSPAPG